MTELERARAHLLHRQQLLAEYRIKIGKETAAYLWPTQIPLGHFLQWHEEAVLAALSWVWEEQTKDNLTKLQDIINTRFC